MKYLTRLCILFLVLGVLFCGKEVNGPDSGPPPPKLWPTPSDTAIVEKGADAIPETDAIQLDWTLEDDKDVEHILLFRRAEDEKQFSVLRRLDRKDSTWVDSDNIKLHVRYYYYLRAVDRDDRQGSPSDTVDYMLLDKAYNLSATSETKPLFRWQIRDYHFHEYVIKVFDASTGDKVWFATVASDYADLDEEVSYNSDSSAKYSNLRLGQQYIWRVDIIGAARNSGSESLWQPFSPP